MRSLALMAVAAAWALGQRSPGQDLLQEAGIPAGLAVHLGTTDGEVEASLTNGGRMLVHGLALDDAALAASRRNLQARGLAGLASVEKGILDPLPYADNLAALVVADPSLRGFSEREVLRVLRPEGVALLRKEGRWATIRKPRPKEMDDWTHFDYGPEGNGVSHDRLIRPATHVQWSFGAQPVALGGNPAGYKVFTGFRVSGSRAFFEWSDGSDKKARETFYSARDAFSGLPLWTLGEKVSHGRKEWQFVARGDRLYTFLEPGGPLAALDASTGKTVRTYDLGGRLTAEPELTTVRVFEGTVIESAGDSLYALDEATGALRWKYVEEGRLLLFASAAPADGKVFAVVAEDRKLGQFGRWPYIKAVAVVCVDLATGQSRWKNVDLAGCDIGQLVYADGALAVFGAGAIGGSKEPTIGRIDAASGKLLWRSTFKTAYNRFGYNLLVRDGTLYYADAWRIYALDAATGKETRPFDDGGYNMRCNRFCATDDWLIYGYVAFVDRSWGGVYQSVTRGGCAQGTVPANGLMYFTPQACRCFTMLRGHLALSSEPLRKPLPDSERLDRGPFAVEPVLDQGNRLPDGPVAADWTRPPRALLGRSLGEEGGGLETEPVVSEGRSYVARIHQHRMEAREASGKVVWSVTAGGRITGPPLLRDGFCYFGSHDGWVYAVRAAEGRIAWRFRAAPSERKYVANNQLESSWPVFGVTMHEGLLCFTAGLHPEVGGGIYAYGVDPASGELKWKKTIRKDPFALEGTSKRPAPVVPNRILNDALRSEGGELVLPGLTFNPRTTDEELKAKIEAPIPKRK